MSLDMPENEYLKIYPGKSIYVSSGNEVEYVEGPQSGTAKHNQDIIKASLENGWLEEVINESILTPDESAIIDEQFYKTLHSLVDSITSEVGRAIVGLTILQLTIKSITPNQSVRLHKASNSQHNFSWREGISMRTIDSNYITPKLREHDLLKLNTYGLMMTRSLAENYPYTSLYKAEIRGAKAEWIDIVNKIENSPEKALPALKLIIAFLKNRSEQFKVLSEKALKKVDEYLLKKPSITVLRNKLFSFPKVSSYSARIFEILIHSFYHTLSKIKDMELFLNPLSQMRSANKKHGNVGDIELLEHPNSMLIIEAWDAKYGKLYLRDELEELKDKLESHPETKLAGFITDEEPIMNREIIDRKNELEVLTGTEIRIASLKQWYSCAIKAYQVEDEFSFLSDWFHVFFEYLCLKHFDVAPIDEPTYTWIEECMNAI
jgi:hypothetical protein